MASRTITLSDKEKDTIVDALLLKGQHTIANKLEKAFKPRAARYGKSKGSSFQNWVAEKLSKLLGFEFSNEDDALISVRSMGLSGQDIILRGSAKAVFPFDIECKAVESLSVPATIEQAKSNTGIDRKWLIAWKNKKFDEPVVVISWSTFEYLWKRNS